MKKIFLSISILIIGNQLSAQTPVGAFLDINNVKAKVNANGTMFSDLAFARFEVPQGSGKNTIFADALWIGGYDNGSQLHISAQTYRQSGQDFWPGPLNNAAMSDSTVSYNMNKVWKLNRCDIQAYHNWIIGGSIGVSPVSASVQNTIASWPAISPYGIPLAPFVDYNGDNIYNPAAGDYPQIKGDQAIFFVYNDRGSIHNESGGGASLGVEIQTMAYAYDCPDSALQHTVFVSYKIVNRTTTPLHNMYVGKWTDFDIGSYSDDFVGCDVTRGVYYGYNGDNTDNGAGGGTYGANPPAEGVVFLKGPYADINAADDLIDSTLTGTGYNDGITDNERVGMSGFIYYQNSSHPVTGNPASALEHYNFLNGKWRDGSTRTYGGDGTGAGVRSRYMFPGTSDPLGFGTGGTPQPAWDEITSGNTPGDRRAIGAMGPFTVQQGITQEMEVAYVFGRDYVNTGNLAGVASMNERIDTVKARYKRSGGLIPCAVCATGTGIQDASANYSLSVYPNPSSDLLHVDYTSASKNISYEIYDITGSLVKQGKAADQSFVVNVNDLTKGLYILKLNDNGTMLSKKFLKE